MFYEKYKGLDKKHKEWAALVMQGKAIQGPLGRSWEIEVGRGRDNELKCPWTQLTNYPVQGTGADVMKIARVSFYRKIHRYGIPCRFVTTVHDSVVVDAEEKYLEEINSLFHEAFADIIPNIKAIFGYDWKTPLECEVKKGQNFKDMEKIK